MVRKKLSNLGGNLSDEEIFFDEESLEATGGDWLSRAEEEGQLAVDVYQTAHEIVVKAPLAGVSEKEVDITIRPDEVTIRGERKEEKEVASENYATRECFWGSFSRSVPLPVEGEPEKAKATFDKGILTIRIPRSKKSHEVKLKING